jgi:ribonuclease R
LGLVQEGEDVGARAMTDTGIAAGDGGGALGGTPVKSSTKRAAHKAAGAEKSPIQSLKAAVKKAAGKSKSRKPRR